MRPMSFSGAPALLLPRAALSAWHGILVRDDERAGEPDFTDDGGNAWFVHDAFDFANPVSHYDHLCAAFQSGSEVLIVRVGDHEAVAISNGDDVVAWWSEQRAIVTNATTPPSDRLWATAEWSPIESVTFNEDTLVLLNASVHGAQVLSGDEDAEHEGVNLPAGRYRLVSCRVDNVFIVRLVRER
jgi:hypothetical protein